MDFFQHQDVARRKTGRLIVYFIVAVALIVLLVNLIVAGALLATGPEAARLGGPGASPWAPELFVGATLGTLALIGGGSLYRMASLASGGHNVAEMMGGRPLSPRATDPDERKILNVVEEMAIASGTPIPPVYLLEQEDGINAFAAGHAPADAVIGVTRGCIQGLDRDELQGVIAHEFSHILNGDMRLNIRLIGVLYGILVISMAGWTIFRSTAGPSRHQSRDNGGERRGPGPWPLIGLALYVLGYVGVFFGNLIKAAVSRQREFLADASAVQFTRNPDGIAGALKKIGALAEGSSVHAPKAQEAGHLFFGDAVGHFSGMFATHPPLVERIRRIDPSFDGDFSRVATRMRPSVPSTPPNATLRPQPRQAESLFSLSPDQVVQSVGTVGPRRIAHATTVLAALPGPLRDLAYEPFGAQAIALALLLDQRSGPARAAQIAHLEDQLGPALAREAERALSALRGLGPAHRLPLISMIVPTLRRLSRDQFESFAACVHDLIEADGQITLFEYACQRALLRRLAPYYGMAPLARRSVSSIDAFREPVRHVLGVLAHVGDAGPIDAARAFSLGARALGWPNVDPSLPPRDLDLRALDMALNALESAAPALKRPILNACAACIGADGRATIEESVMLRTIADALECPVPPLQWLSEADTARGPAQRPPE